MPELKGSKTEKNLQDAFAGESQARNKYTFYASAAKRDGYEQIAAIFLETADNEKEHAKLHFRALSGSRHGGTSLPRREANTRRQNPCTRAWPARRVRRVSRNWRSSSEDRGH